MSVQEIKEEALKLTPEDREWLAQELWESVAEDDPELIAELDRRWEEIESGKVRAIPHEEVMAHCREALKKMREERTLSSRSA